MSHVDFHWYSWYSSISLSCPCCLHMRIYETCIKCLTYPFNLTAVSSAVCQVPDWYISAEAGRRPVLQGLHLLEQEQIFPELRVEGQILTLNQTVCSAFGIWTYSRSPVNALASPCVHVAWCCACIRKVFVAANEGADHAANATGQQGDTESIRHLQSPSSVVQCWRIHVLMSTPRTLMHLNAGWHHFCWLTFSDFRKSGFSMPWVEALENPEKSVQCSPQCVHWVISCVHHCSKDTIPESFVLST